MRGDSFCCTFQHDRSLISVAIFLARETRLLKAGARSIRSTGVDAASNCWRNRVVNSGERCCKERPSCQPWRRHLEFGLRRATTVSMGVILTRCIQGLNFGWESSSHFFKSFAAGANT
jgi:hypothetical protein